MLRGVSRGCFAVLALLAQPLFAEADAASAAPRALTQQGPVEGEASGTVLAFRGIPYAAPPVGALRFRAPQSPVKREGVLSALDMGPACPQLIDADLTENNHAMMAEDCLSLNVWTPGTDARKRPVMVWIHGGAYVVGSVRNTGYDGSRLAARGDVVVVSINYRLGAWGFLALADHGSSYDGSANAGLLDQIAALRWVQQNISVFGGDPGNVTIFGESAGASSAGALLSMPQAAGLFSRAILQSGLPSNQTPHAYPRSKRLAAEFLTLLGATSPAEIQGRSMQDLLDAQDALFTSHSDLGTFGPVVDGITLKEPPFTVVSEGRGNRVPILVGTTGEEMRYFTSVYDIGLERKPRALMQEQLKAAAGPRAAEVLATYEKLYPDWGDVAVQIASDAFLRLPSIRLAEAVTGFQPVYMYLFSYRSTSSYKRFGSMHSIEIPFVFGTVDLPEVIAYLGRSPHRAELSARTMDHWVAFARHGNPALPGGMLWPRYDLQGRQTMELGPESKLVSDPLGEQRRAWGEQLPSKDSAWQLLQKNH